MQSEGRAHGDPSEKPPVAITTANNGWLCTTASTASYDSWTVLLTVKQVANRLGLGRSKVYELLDSGELGSLKIGTARRVPLGAVGQFIERNMDSAASVDRVTPMSQNAARGEESRS